VDIGIAVSGMLDATVTGNRLGLELVDLDNCPDTVRQCGPANPPPSTAAVVASRCAGLASGTIQDGEDFRILACLGPSHPQPSCDSGLNTTAPSRWRGWAAKLPRRQPVTPTLSLDEVFPNPTRGEIVVRYTLPATETAQLEVLDLAGRRVARRDAGDLSPGPHEITLGRSERLAPGIYVVKLRQGTVQRVRHVVVLK
jgi:hypothetical protein